MNNKLTTITLSLLLLLSIEANADTPKELKYVLTLPTKLNISSDVEKIEQESKAIIFSSENQALWHNKFRVNFRQGFEEGLEEAYEKAKKEEERPKWITFFNKDDPTKYEGDVDSVDKEFTKTLPKINKKKLSDDELIQFAKSLDKNIDVGVLVHISLSMTNERTYEISIEGEVIGSSLKNYREILWKANTDIGDPKYFKDVGKAFANIFFRRFGKNEITRAEADRYLQEEQRNWRKRKPAVDIASIKATGEHFMELLTTKNSDSEKEEETERTVKARKQLATLADPNIYAAGKPEYYDSSSCGPSGCQQVKRDVDISFSIDIVESKKEDDHELGIPYTEYSLEFKADVKEAEYIKELAILKCGAGDTKNQTKADNCLRKKLNSIKTQKFRVYESWVKESCNPGTRPLSSCEEIDKKLDKVMEVAVFFIHDFMMHLNNTESAETNLAANVKRLETLEREHIIEYRRDANSLRRQMAWRNALFPGWGYSYVNQNFRGRGWNVAFALSLGYVFLNMQKFNQAQNEYDQFFFTGNLLFDASIYSQRRDELNQAETGRNVSLGILSVVYIYTILDSLLIIPKIGLTDEEIKESHRRGLGRNPYENLKVSSWNRELSGSYALTRKDSGISIEYIYRF